MTQEYKELLLKDLPARLPYGVKCKVSYNSSVINDVDATLYSIDKDGFLIFDEISGDHREFLCKPYLFPISSMTEEQKNDCPISETNLNIINSNIGYGIIEMPWRLSYLFVDWCNKNHFDYRGLIEKGLANDATGLNIY